ncbi:hypothetical protein JG687_00004066 [Phytophthora cactorum]|uniref:Uncharacterized protein n=2 Tax=Phytophthora TaxID=4783 RepID=A0A8J5J9Z1_9STRA|nr:hypothetical protein JG687_00004066 [Phytophthora cactorum]KAG6972433.1 hypothetical protein JG688_00003995 [Phytophthora aleatoria]
MRIPPQVPDGAAEPIWKLATRAAIKLMSTALYSKRFIGASALLLYGYASYPIAEPTSTHSLRLAQGLDAHELDRNDPFAINVRKIAARVGVKNPERISIRVGEQSAGASMGANLTVGQRGACIVLPMELYDAFYAPAHLHAKYDIPKRDEIDFNHSMFTGAFLPASLVGSCVAIHKIPNKLVAGIVGVLGIVGGNLYLSWSLEHEADQVAAESGFARGGINCFQRKLSRNCEMRSVLKTWMITEKGNYLGDTSHPLLTSRIERLKLLTSAETIKLVVATEDDRSEDDTY